MLDVAYNPPPAHGIDWADPGQVARYEESQNIAIQQAFNELRRKGNNPKYIQVHGQTLQKIVGGSVPWPGELKLFTGTLAQARAWGRKYDWNVADGSTSGVPDLRHLFLRGAGDGQDAGETGGCDTHGHANTLATPDHCNHSHCGDVVIDITPCTSYESVCGTAGDVQLAPYDHDHLYICCGFTTCVCGPLVHDALTGSVTAGSTLPGYYEVIILVKGQWNI